MSKTIAIYKFQGSNFMQSFPVQMMQDPSLEIWFQANDGECISNTTEWDFWCYL